MVYQAVAKAASDVYGQTLGTIIGSLIVSNGSNFERLVRDPDYFKQQVNYYIKWHRDIYGDGWFKIQMNRDSNPTKKQEF